MNTTVAGYDPLKAFNNIKSAHDAAQQATQAVQQAAKQAQFRLVEPIHDALTALSKSYNLVLKGDYGGDATFILPDLHETEFTILLGYCISPNEIKVNGFSDQSGKNLVAVQFMRQTPYKSEPAQMFNNWIEAYEYVIELLMPHLKSAEPVTN